MRTASVLLSFFLFSTALFFNLAWAATSASPVPDTHKSFVHCLLIHARNSTSISQLIYTPVNSSFVPLWRSNINNARFDVPSTPKPYLIVTPENENHIQTVIHCSQKHGINLRIRGAGHDFEGLSYTANTPFAMLDLTKMRAVRVDKATKTAWVQGGADFGEFYYYIGQQSKTLAFPGGTWANVGVAGLTSGGGYGVLNRKYGLAADHAIDARLINAKGQILDRKSMGEDLFWAIRGGGASSFGVIVEWKFNLVDVPETVTVWATTRTLEQNATSIFHKWQTFAPSADRDLFLRTQLSTITKGTSGKKTVLITFDGVFLGKIDRLMKLLHKGFPELGLKKEECTEVSYVQSALVISAFSSQAPPEILLNRTATVKFSIKGKSEFVEKPIPIKGLEGLWRLFLKTDVRVPNFVLSPYGGRMNDFSSSDLPFWHRPGKLYIMLQWANLDPTKPAQSRRRINWLRSVHTYMTRYVPNSPRHQYLKYNDLDLGVGAKTFAEASIWGDQYFGGNFKRLVQIKSKVDPNNFFHHPQSIPPFSSP